EALNWFESYITDRKQFVRIGSSVSEVLPITHGVAQGAILSPLLFCIYINNLSRVLQASELESFVDNSKIFMSFPIEDIASAKTKIEEDLKLVATWFFENKLLINPEKTKLLLIGTLQLLGKLLEETTITFLGEEIRPTTNAKDLGLTLDTITISKMLYHLVHTYKGFYWCDYCKNFLWGLKQQGHKCQDCGLNAHKQCVASIKEKNHTKNCQPHKKLVKRVFGVDLTTLVKAHNTKLPTILEECVREVEKRGMTSEGIYRVSGFADDIENLKSSYDKGDVVDIGPSKFDDINIIAGALKLYLRMLPLPVITFETYNNFIEAIQLEKHESIEAIGRALQELPHAHYATLKYIISHLTIVTRFSKDNMMNSENLSIIFGPTLMRLPEEKSLLESQHYIKLQKLIVQSMIDEYETLFGI
ncbi:beta-chimaerin-like isoform X1, partial [Paramuricea clavata]